MLARARKNPSMLCRAPCVPDRRCALRKKPSPPDPGCSTLVAHDSAPEALGSPDTGTQTFQLDDLAVVHEKVHLRSVVLDVPGEHLRVGRLEHHPLQPQGVDDL